MKQSLVLSILLLSLISPIHARNKPHHDEESPSPSSSSSSPSPAPGPSNSNCSDVVVNMIDCLNYLTPGTNETKPTKSCCDSIKGVIEYNPECLCYGLKNAKDMGVVLNNTRAVDMPKTCNLANAPHCNVKIPSAATPSAPTPISASTPSMSPVSPSSGTPMTSPTSSTSPATSPSSSQSPVTSPSSSQSPETSPPLAESPVTSPSSDDSPATTTTPSPTGSATNNLSVPILTLVAALVSSIANF